MARKKTNLFFKIIGLLFIIYMVVYIAYKSGYYETKVTNKALMTEEARAQFEEDLKNGEIVDLKTYLKEDRIDYSNKITKVGNKISESISDFMTKGIGSIFKVLKGLFW